MDTKTRDFSGNFSRGSTRALVETMCSVFLWNSYPKMWTNEQKGAHLGTKPFAMLKLLKWNCKVRRIMPTAWGCTRPTSTAMSGCPGTAMPCLQSHVHLVGRNPQVLSCQQSSDLNSQWTQELSTSVSTSASPTFKGTVDQVLKLTASFRPGPGVSSQESILFFQ